MKLSLPNILPGALLVASACAVPVDQAEQPEVAVVEQALGTVTLVAGGSTAGYDFSAGVATNQSGGDFYFTQGAFWANNVGQRGVVSVGTCSSPDAVTTIPTTGYSRFNVASVAGRCYVALTHNDERDYIVFRVTSTSSTQATLSWKLVATGNWGANLTSGSSSSSGYDFSARTYKGQSGGDFYFGSGQFWANNVGQRGIVRLGPCSKLEDITQPPPETGYWRAGTLATAGECYASLTQNEEHDTILFRVDSLTSVNVLLTWKLVDYCFGYASPRGSVACWLLRNPGVASYLVWENRNSLGSATPLAWSSWSNARRDELRANVRTYTAMLDNASAPDPDPLADPPINQEPRADSAFPVAVLSFDDAWRLYVKTVAMSLAVELKQFVPWSVVGKAYDGRGKASLFDSRHLLSYTWSGRPNPPGGVLPSTEGYMVIDNAYASSDHTTFAPMPGYALPASPVKSLKFLRDKALIGTTRLQTISKVVDWSRRLHHWSGSLNTLVFQNHWQYRGPAPVVRTIDATIDAADPTVTAYHYTAGCHGTAVFLQSVLRTVNIPVDGNWVAGTLAHAVPRFMTEGRYLSHGDDPYYQNDIYGVPADALLITEATYAAWFTNVSTTLIDENTGRGNPEAMIKNLSGRLQESYCNDLAQGLGHAAGAVFHDSVFADRPHVYTLAYLETQLPPDPLNPGLSLWDRLGNKVNAQGGCQMTLASIAAQRQACEAVMPPAERLRCTW